MGTGQRDVSRKMMGGGVGVGGESKGTPVVLFNKSSSRYTRMVYLMIGLF